MAFETFDKRRVGRTKQALVTIQRGGNFSFNKATYDLLAKPEAVELLYDREREIIGFRKTSLENPRAFPLRPQGKNAVSFMVAGQAFTKHYEIDTTTARRYPVKLEGDILTLDLQGESADVTGPRLGAGKDAGK
jgi:hypothetical protein